MSASGVLLLRNSNRVKIKGFRDPDADEGEYLNAATTRTWEVRTAKSPGGSAVASGNLTYVTGSNGVYSAVITPAAIAALVEGTDYWLHLVLEEGGVQGDWEIPVTAQRRLGTRPTG